MKKWVLFIQLFAIVYTCLLTACGGDDDENVSNISVIIRDDGTTSNGSLFAAVDDKNFYLDYVKYTLVESHLIVSGYDSKGFSGIAKMATRVSFKGNSYEVLEIGRNAFRDCTILTSVTMPNNVTYIGDYAFCNCTGVKSFTIPSSVTKFGKYAFDGCAGKLIINCNIVNAGREAHSVFSNSNFDEIVIGDGVTFIDSDGFAACKSVKSITIPNSVTSIGAAAFSGCSSLTSITLPNSVTSIGNYTFARCSSLTTITIPNSVTSIEWNAFSECSSLTSITIPNSVTTIGDFTFQYCTSLTSITIPNGVTNIGDMAFVGCTSLTSVAISKGVTAISYGAFAGCTGLTSITIPNSVTSIESLAFTGCSKLKDVYCHIEKPNNVSVASNCFYDSNLRYATLHVPAASIAVYKNLLPWRDFASIVTL